MVKRPLYVATCSCNWTNTNYGNEMFQAVSFHMRQTVKFASCHTMVIERLP